VLVGIKTDSKKITDAVFTQPKVYALRYGDGAEVVHNGLFQEHSGFVNFKNKFYKSVGGCFDMQHSVGQIYTKRRFIKNKKETLPLTNVEGVYI
jgi:hypothetical protein